MKNKLYIVISGLLVLFVSLKLLLIKTGPILLKYFDILFYILIFLLFYIICGKPRNKHYLKNISTRYIIILLLSYLIIIYLLGIFTGFVKTAYSLQIVNIIKNIFPIVIITFIEEYTKFIVAKKCFKNIKPYIYFTIFLSLINILNVYFVTTFNSYFQIFNFICLIILPTITKQFVSSYITYNISYTPTLIYNLSFAISPYIFSIYPDLGNYLNSLLGVLFPFIIYITMHKIISASDKTNINLTKNIVTIMSIPFIIITIIFIVLISGVFSYKMIAIASNSMNPVYYRGDAIIYEKDTKNISKNDIIVYKNGENIITHRVTDIVKKGNKTFYQTRGDNNEAFDPNLVDANNVLGKVKYIVKYVGYPTIILNEYLRS